MSMLSTFTLLFDTDADEAAKDVEEFTSSTEKSEEASKKAVAQAKKERDEREKSRKETNSMIRSLGELIGSYIGLRAVASGVLTSAFNVDSLNTVATAFGLSATEMERWGRIADRAGGSSESFQRSIVGLQSNLAKITTPDGNDAFIEGLAMIGGISVVGDDGNIKTAEQLLPELISQFEGLSGAEAMVLGSAIGLDESSLAVIMKGTDELQRHADEVDKAYATTSEDINTFTQYQQASVDAATSFDGVMVKLGGITLPVVADVLSSISGFLNDLTSLDDVWFTVIVGGITSLMSLPWILLAGRVIGLGGAFATLSASLVPLLPYALLIVLAIAAIALAFYGLKWIFDDISAYFRGEDSMTGAILDWFGRLWNETVEFFGGWVSKIIGYFKELKESASGWVSEMVDSIIGYFLGLKERGVKSLSDFIADIKSMFLGVKDWLSNLDLFGFVGRGFDSLKELVGFGSDVDDIDGKPEKELGDPVSKYDPELEVTGRERSLDGTDQVLLSQVLEQGDQALAYSGGLNSTAGVIQRATNQVVNRNISMTNQFDITINADGLSSEAAETIIPRSLADEFEFAIASMNDGVIG
ncbi:hypothetical protein VCHA30O60_50146 [Vibrio chagasii]|nr:hypothetical protein VCHA30O60_50146 [Vibrio chagasii]